MPDVASHSKIASAHGHLRATAQAAGRGARADHDTVSPFADMLDGSTPQPHDQPGMRTDDADPSSSKSAISNKDKPVNPGQASDADAKAAETSPAEADTATVKTVVDPASAAATSPSSDANAQLAGMLENAKPEETAADEPKTEASQPDAVIIPPTPQPQTQTPVAAPVLSLAAHGLAKTKPDGETGAIGDQPQSAPDVPQAPIADDGSTPAPAKAASGEQQPVKPSFTVETGDAVPALTNVEKHAAQMAAADAAGIDTATPSQPAHLAAAAATHAAAASTSAAPAANTSATAAGQTPVPVNAVAVEIVAHASAGNKRFEIRLDPPELGKIDVRLTIDKHGQVASHLVVEKAETLDLLRRDAPQLERALQDAGLKTSGNGLQFSLQQQTQQGQGQDFGQNGTARQTGTLLVGEDTLAPDVIQRGYAQRASARGGVDIRV